MDNNVIDSMASCVSGLLSDMGEDPNREGLLDTPKRVARMYLEMTRGLRTEAPKITTFSPEEPDQMVTVLDIDYWSMCEHHLVPFYGKVHIGYMPGDRIAGLSKFARVVDWYARRPQIQERFTAQIATFLYKELDPAGVIVAVSGTHLCMAMRGVEKPNHQTITSAIRGDIDKSEFFDLLKIRG